MQKLTSVARSPLTSERAPRLQPLTQVATLILCIGLCFTALLLPSDLPSNVFSTAAYGIGASLLCSIGIEARAGIRNLLRTDILMLVALYSLTFLEFWFPQPRIDRLTSASAAVYGTELAILGFVGLALGRFAFPFQMSVRGPLTVPELSPRRIFVLFLVAASIGYAHILIAVNFDPVEMARQMMAPRFSQSWSRGRIGGADTILVEFGAVIYLIPPLAGIVLSAPRRYSILQVSVVIGVLGLTLFYGFAGGTRNIFVTYIITLVAGYLVTRRKLRLREVIAVGIPALAVLSFAIYFMIDFRTGGFADYDFSNSKIENFQVDYAMVNISNLTTVFPEVHEFLGLEIPYNVLIRPIPRFLWPGKPEGLSISIEEALRVEGLTLATTFIGETYMSGGIIGVILGSLLFGASAAWWNRLDRPTNTGLQKLLFVSGFFWAAITMRSAFLIGPALIPSFALWLYGRILPRRSITVSSVRNSPPNVPADPRSPDKSRGSW